MEVPTTSKISDSSLINWLFEDRSLDEIKSDMTEARTYVKALQEQARKIKKRKTFKGKIGAKGLLVKGDSNLSNKISLAEYQLGMALRALLTPSNFAFFADKVKIVGKSKEDEELDLEVASKSNALVLELDALEPAWRATRARISKYIHDYALLMGMDIELPKDSESLAQALRELSSEVTKLYTEASPEAADAISRQAHRKLLDFQSASVQGMQSIDPDSISKEEVRISHAYQKLLKDVKAKKISQKDFVQEVALLAGKLPKEVRSHWMKAIASQKSHHTEYAKYLSNTIAPLVASLDAAFNPREILRVIGHNFEPDYLLKTLDGRTLWGEYLGMSEAGSSAGTHYNIRSEFKKMGYGNNGVFFYPQHLPRFPNPGLIETLHSANILGFDSVEKEYYTVVDGNKDYIRTHSA